MAALRGTSHGCLQSVHVVAVVLAMLHCYCLAAAGAATVSSSDASSLEEQMRLLSKQVGALLDRRREDIQIIEDNMRKSLEKSKELVGVKEEMKNLR